MIPTTGRRLARHDMIFAEVCYISVIIIATDTVAVKGAGPHNHPALSRIAHKMGGNHAAVTCLPTLAILHVRQIP
jgi:hypothetical protein